MLCPSVGKGHDSPPWLSLLLGCAAIWINMSNAPSLVEGWWSAPAHRSVVVEHHFLNHASSVMLEFYAQSISNLLTLHFSLDAASSLLFQNAPLFHTLGVGTWKYVLFPPSLSCVGFFQYLSELAPSGPVLLVCLISSLEIILLVHVWLLVSIYLYPRYAFRRVSEVP